MEFPNYLREASQMGLTKDELLRVWETETQIERIKVETRLLETQLRKSDINEVSRSNLEDKLTVVDNLMPALQQLLRELISLKQELKSQRQLQENNLNAVVATQFKLEELRASLNNEMHFLQQETQQNVQHYGRLLDEFANLKRFIAEENETKFESMKNFIDQKIGILNHVIESNGAVKTSEELQDVHLIHSNGHVRNSDEAMKRGTRRAPVTQPTDNQTVRESPNFENDAEYEPQGVKEQWKQSYKTVPADHKVYDKSSSQTPRPPKGAVTYDAECLKKFPYELLEEPKSDGNDLAWQLVGDPNIRSANIETVTPEISNEADWGQYWPNENVAMPNQEPITNAHSLAAGETHGVVYIPTNKAVFIIPNCGALLDIENKDFYTSYLYTRPKTCRIRMRLWFNKRGHLGVQALVSEGVFDENHKWPLIFSGNGYIRNPESRKNTLIWTVAQQECNRPKQGEELPLGASVVLTTSRGAHNIVTHELLEKKHYIENNLLKFRWDLKAEEIIAEPRTENTVAFGNEHDVSHVRFWSS
ncbi:unnamed protein product [Lymnaea stagnalis]|uniref:Uncharacterized protein n=1 Tax=Lymnaea stagnalis TaxID=6523 RepID=A0AAV2HKQ4_LYMST